MMQTRRAEVNTPLSEHGEKGRAQAFARLNNLNLCVFLPHFAHELLMYPLLHSLLT